VAQSYLVIGFLAGIVVAVAGAAILSLWVKVARATGRFASRRGYPRFAGVAAGLLAGPLAMIVFALLPSKAELASAA
jgi:hypothetical protein